MTETIEAEGVVEFWTAAGPTRWFAKDDAFDAEIATRFAALHHAAARRELDGWAAAPRGALALLILLDQFPRNMFRGSGHAFATDPLALALARQSVERGFDQQVEAVLRPFFYLPFEHSELMENQDRSVALCEALRDAAGDQKTLDYAILHRDIIARFGRFPHRNAALARESTAEELAFLAGGGFSG